MIAFCTVRKPQGPTGRVRYREESGYPQAPFGARNTRKPACYIRWKSGLRACAGRHRGHPLDRKARMRRLAHWRTIYRVGKNYLDHVKNWPHAGGGTG